MIVKIQLKVFWVLTLCSIDLDLENDRH